MSQEDCWYCLRALFEPSPDEPQTESLESYVYEQLPPRSIRLIRLHPPRGCFIHSRSQLYVDLSVTNIDDGDVFDALSYTWGPPTLDDEISLSAEDSISRSNWYPVICDGRVIHITSSLRDALFRIRMMQTSEARNRARMDGMEEQLQELLWADGICINQENSSERSAQVGLMCAVYRRASLVIAWVGPADDFSKRGLQMTANLANLATRTNLVSDERPMEDPEFWQRYELALPSWEDWRSWTIFMCRNWFFRTWVVQEVALGGAERVLLQCGSLNMQLFAVVNALGFLLKAGWYLRLGTLVSARIQGNGVPRDETLHNYQHILDLWIQGHHPMHDLVKIWRELKSEGSISFLSASSGIFRRTRSTDPRDQIYGLMGVVSEFQTTAVGVFTADYNLSPEEVYVSAVRHGIMASSSLDMLSAVAGKTFATGSCRSETLPSWCPDFSLSMATPGVILSKDDSRYRASALSKCQIPQSNPLTGCLEVQGYCLDIIFNTIDAFESCWSIKGHLALVEFLLSRGEELSQHPSLPEFLWRTLLCDDFNPHNGGRGYEDNPAHEDSLKVFVMFLRDIFGKDVYNKEDIENETLDYHSKRQRLIELNDSFANVFPEHDLQAQREDPLLWAWKWNDEWGYAFISIAHAITRRLESIIKNRKLFSTKTLFMLGLGHDTLKQDDQVWLLEGGKMAYILRRLPSGSYQFLGESYVHGIMHGELWPTAKENLVRIFIN